MQRFRWQNLFIITFCGLLLISIASKIAGLFDGHYSLRKWIWYSFGLLTAFGAMYLATPGKNQHKRKISPLLVIGSLIPISILFVLLHPVISVSDQKHFLKRNLRYFERVKEIADQVFHCPGMPIDSCLFFYTGKRLVSETYAGGMPHGYSSCLTDQLEGELSGFMYSNEIRQLSLHPHKIDYYFNTNDKDFLSRTDSDLQGSMENYQITSLPQ